MELINKILGDFETLSAEGIKDCFDNGINPNQIIDGKPLVYRLINMYARGPQFKECIKVFVDNGLNFDDDLLLAVLLDDADNLNAMLTKKPSLIMQKYSLDCAFTPLYRASLLHICAEYDHLDCAKVLINHGIDINIKAGIDENGFGGHTPIFHTVNQNRNICIDMLKYLVSLKADLAFTIKGLIWGKGYKWETYIPLVNPMSYAMMGLIRQFQRSEEDIYFVVSILEKAAFGSEYQHKNIPNKYLHS